MNKLKVLVFSNSAISDDESNGRVLKSLLPDCKECQYMNIYTSGIPSIGEIIEYHRFSDKSIIKSILSLGILNDECGALSKKADEHVCAENIKKSKRKNAFQYFVRNLLWSLSLKTKKKIRKYSHSFSPNVVFLMGANFPFFYKMSVTIARELSAKLIIYTAEDYPIKKYNYIVGNSRSSFFYKLVKKKLYREALRAYRFASFNVFNTQKLLDSYCNEGLVEKSNSLVIKIPSSLSSLNNIENKKEILYAGNLYDDRCKSLIEIADCMSKIKTDFKLVVYGSVQNENYLSIIKNHKSIIYRGVVSFSELKNYFDKPSFLLHVDGFDDYSLLDYCHAFSTKIADYLILGTPFICYGSLDIAGVEYLYNLNKDFTITSKESLFEKLNKILNREVTYKIDKKKIIKEFSMNECRSEILNLFK